jgi:hypothetical protein
MKGKTMLDTMTKESALKHLAIIKQGIKALEERDGYCEHGNYVGGCGVDYICAHCENGEKRNAYHEALFHAKRARDLSRVGEMKTMFQLGFSDAEVLRFLKQNF